MDHVYQLISYFHSQASLLLPPAKLAATVDMFAANSINLSQSAGQGLGLEGA